ncbi:23S rRNA pseudouridine2457 synthase [Filimonas zeae]|uniref:Pseudouridine synthase n=1 Tax=Filimonas zeae TaxID=1737353 RepID=A0A917J6I1_9BACT|nr:pseudouridine synthase [Filimonas zeae]MDR6342410.1 23S rRNA pseudouridine2457 synthase [Filimonas zeae]GGH81207.1 pseudouridine synthase [Filimonas zeae]
MTYYFAIYKPYLVLSQFSTQDRNKQTLKDYFDVPSDVYPVGRLDYDSEGLLLLTNDTRLNHRLLHPSFAHEREYWVQVDGAVGSDAIQQLAKGVVITPDGKPYHTKPCRVQLLSPDPQVPDRTPPIRFRKEIPAPWLQMILTEGKNRQVRRMTAAVGFPTLRLIRQRMEDLTLGSLQPGEMISLNRKTILKKLFHE